MLTQKASLIVAICEANELPKDVRLYLTQFYMPFARAAREKRIINRLHRNLSNVDMFNQAIYDCKCDYFEKIRSKLKAHFFTLDTRIKDGRIETLVKCVQPMLKLGVPIVDVMDILIKGMEVDDLQAFNALWCTNARCSHPSVVDYLRRHTREFTALPIWEIPISSKIKPIINYCIQNEIDDLLLEWIAIWPFKGADVVKICAEEFYSGHDNKQELIDTCILRLRSPELKERRMYFLKRAMTNK